MSDLFGEFVTDDYVAAVFGAMAVTQQHIYQVLTKRAQRMEAWFRWAQSEPRAQSETLPGSGGVWPLPNVHLGVSVEDRKYGLPRIDHLRRVPAAVRFLSVEPLLEDIGEIDLTSIHWVIVGGESGPGARPMHPDWVRHIREQCVAAKVPFFFKQWGAWHQGTTRVGKKVAGRILDGRTWDEMPSGIVAPKASHRSLPLIGAL